MTSAILVDSSSGNGLLSYGTEPLSESMLTFWLVSPSNIDLSVISREMLQPSSTKSSLTTTSKFTQIPRAKLGNAISVRLDRWFGDERRDTDMLASKTPALQTMRVWIEQNNDSISFRIFYIQRVCELLWSLWLPVWKFKWLSSLRDVELTNIFMINSIEQGIAWRFHQDVCLNFRWPPLLDMPNSVKINGH